MIRVNASDVVRAYMLTNRIPIRRAWQSESGRGSDAIDAYARARGAQSGEDWADEHLDPNYLKGFLTAWDAEKPEILQETSNGKNYLIGYWDAILCRDAVEQEFNSNIRDITPNT